MIHPKARENPVKKYMDGTPMIGLGAGN